MIVHLSILFILLLINLIPNSSYKRKKYVLPISFLIVVVYWALRYDYGLDYWNYYNMFYNDVDKYATGWGEKFFFSFTHIFQYYYQVVIAESVILGVSLFHLARKYIPEEFYWLFFFSLFAVYNFHFCLISAQRTTMAACILYWAYELFYVNNKRWVLFFLSVFLAANFHTSALFFGVIPLFYYVFNSLKGRTIFIILLVCSLLSMLVLNNLVESLVESSEMTEAYAAKAGRIESTTFIGFLYNLLYVLLPTYFICLVYDKMKNDIIYRSIFILAFSLLSIKLLGLDFHARFTVYLFPFFIIALSKTCALYTKEPRLIILSPYILISLYSLYNFYHSMFTQLYLDGNPFYYQTIFDAVSLP